MRNLTNSTETQPAAVHYRPPRLSDGPAVHALVRRCEPLDLNSPYSYLLLCTDFAATCAVAERDGELVGFVSGYLKPADPRVLFIWQVAVSPAARGLGVGKGLLRAVLDRPACVCVEHLDTTVTPSNAASWAMFHSLARERGARCTRQPIFRAEDFGEETHEEEHLLRIGPIHEKEAE